MTGFALNLCFNIKIAKKTCNRTFYDYNRKMFGLLNLKVFLLIGLVLCVQSINL